MADLTRDDIRSMGKAVGLEIEEPELTEVMYSLNALLEALDGINPPGPGKRRAAAYHPAASLVPAPLSPPVPASVSGDDGPAALRARARLFSF